MGKAARFFCILTPMLCTLASMVCVVVVMLGGTNKGNAMLSDLWFFKLDVRHVTDPKLEPNIDIPGTDLDNQLFNDGLKTASAELGLADFYTAHLWNYCSGEVTTDNGKDVWKTTECGKPSTQFYFDSIKILNLEGEQGQGVDESQFPESIVKINKAIKIASNFMVAMYICGAVATALTFFVGWFGLLSRWGSCVTTLVADVAFLFLLAGSTIATGLYFALRTGYDKALKDFGAKASISNKMLSITWIAVAFSLGAAIFWMMSTCCCSGRSSRIMGREERRKGKGTMRVEKTPYTYERVASPYVENGQGTNVVPMSSIPPARKDVGYEPYRHGGAH